MRPKEMNEPDSPFYLAANVINNGSMRPWFKASPLGVNKLNSIMKVMAMKAGLTNPNLTNHSVRKRLVQKLVSSNVPPTEIMQITGHKNVQSINNYSSLCEKKMHDISNILSENACGKSVAQASNHVTEITSKRTLTESMQIAECSSSKSVASLLPSVLQNAVFNGNVQISFHGSTELKSRNINVEECRKKRRVIIDSDSDYSQ